MAQTRWEQREGAPPEQYLLVLLPQIGDWWLLAATILLPYIVLFGIDSLNVTISDLGLLIVPLSGVVPIFFFRISLLLRVLIALIYLPIIVSMVVNFVVIAHYHLGIL